MQHAIGSAHDDVAGVEPAAAPGFLGGRLVVEVSRKAAPAGRRLGMAEQHLARLPAGEVALLIVDHANFHPGDFPPKRARADLAGLAAIRQDAHHLRHSPDFDQGKAEALLDRAMELRLDAGPDAETHGVRSLVRIRRLAVEHGSNDAEVMHDGRLCLGDLAPPPLRMEAFGLNLAIARQDGAEQRQDARVRVIERQRVVDTVLAGMQDRQAAERGIARPRGDFIALRQDAALGPPRRSRGVEDAGGRLGRWIATARRSTRLCQR
jgi:hypothetical protein